MQPALLIRLRPAGPWRYGPGDGGDDRVDAFYRSDRLFSALTLAFQQLGLLEEWLDATARAATSAVTLTSLFPYQGDMLFAPPPASAWPPAASLLTAPSPVFLSKVRWSAVRFVPLAVIESLVSGQPILADQWMADAESGCLLRRDRPQVSPLRTVLRGGAAVDRMGRAAVNTHSLACVEFEAASGLWCVVRFADKDAGERWKDRVKAALRLLADTGFGGKRTSGWGQSEAPQFAEGEWPAVLFPKLARGAKNGSNGDETPLYWLLSLYSPGANDEIEWSGGDYELVVRGGRVESSRASGARKRSARMVAEGSVIASRTEPVGAAVDVAPGGLEHPVYRSGFAVALKLPSVVVDDIQPVEIPADEEAPETKPCPQGEDTRAPERMTEVASDQVAESAPKPVEEVASEPESIGGGDAQP